MCNFQNLPDFDVLFHRLVTVIRFSNFSSQAQVAYVKKKLEKCSVEMRVCTERVRRINHYLP